MAHEITTINGQDSFAHVGATAWHGLGQQLTEGASLQDWTVNAGLNWTALQMPNQLARPDGTLFNAGCVSLVRSDTLQDPEPVVLGTVSTSWHPVQPVDALEAMAKICESLGASMETAGALNQGRKIFALAKMPNTLDLGKDDRTEQYAVIYTGFDKLTATCIKQTSIRVVCANTLSLCVAQHSNNSSIAFSHNVDPTTRLNANQIAALTDDWRAFETFALQAASTTLKGQDLREFMHVLASRLVLAGDLNLTSAAQEMRAVERLESLSNLYGRRGKIDGIDDEQVYAVRAAARVAALRESLVKNAYGAPGQHTEAAHDSLWGAVNAVSYTFGQGQDMERRGAKRAENIAERRLGMTSNKHEKILAELVSEILTRPATGVSLEDVGIGLDDQDNIRAQVLTA